MTVSAVRSLRQPKRGPVALAEVGNPIASRWGTIVIASKNSSAAGQAAADFVADDGGFEVTMAEAVAALPESLVLPGVRFGRIVLLEGFYTASDTVILPLYVRLQGQGDVNTSITWAAAEAPPKPLVAGAADNSVAGGRVADLTIVASTGTAVAGLTYFTSVTILGDLDLSTFNFIAVNSTLTAVQTVVPVVGFLRNCDIYVNTGGMDLQGGDIRGGSFQGNLEVSGSQARAYVHGLAVLGEVLISATNANVTHCIIEPTAGDDAITITGDDNIVLYNAYRLSGGLGVVDLGTNNVVIDTAIDDHVGGTDAHDASAISYAGGTGMSAANVEAAIDELATEKQNAADPALFAVKDADESYTRRGIRFINGSNVTVEIADDSGGDEVEVTISSSSGGSVATDTIFDAKGDLPVGTGADTAARLPAGSNGQILSADSAETTGLKWIAAPSGSGAVATDTIFDAKGDLPVGTGADTAARLPVGSNGLILTADSAETTGLKWAAAGSGSVAADTIWNAAGDLAVGTGSDTAARLAIGSNGDVLSVVSGAVAWAAPSGGGDMTKIAETILGSNAANITFSSIPGTYTHLLIEILARNSAAGTTNLLLRFNGDTAANYDKQRNQGSGTTSAALFTAGDTSAEIGVIPGSGASSGLFSISTIHVPHYTGTTAHKLINVTYAHKEGTSSGNMRTGTYGSAWRSTAAVTSITILQSSGTDLLAGSMASLYGMA